jgi:hypothetical protein
MKLRHASFAVVVVLLAVAPAVAQEAAPAAAPPSQPAPETAAPAPAPPEAPVTPPDIVILRNGGMLRGTIAELVPGSYVVVTLATGESRRIPMVEVTYAGPTANAPSAAPAPVPAIPGPFAQPPAVDQGVPIRFLGEQESLTLHRHVGTATGFGWSGSNSFSMLAYSYSAICSAPCESALPAGGHRLAVSRESGTPVDAGMVQITGPGTLTGSYTSRRGLRIAGWITLAAGTAVGMAIAMGGGFGAASDDPDDPNFTIHWGWFGAGMGVMLVSEIVGLILGMQRDRARIAFQPN